MVKTKLEERLKRSKQNYTSIVGHRVLANHWILSSVWYLLTLYPGDPKDLDDIQRQIVEFIWAGQKEGKTRHRVDAATIT
jgi:hypothetical protein